MAIINQINIPQYGVNRVNSTLLFANIYAHAGSLYVNNLPNCILEEQCVILGDLNARHKDLGSSSTSNINGIRWKAFLDSSDSALLTGENVPTHVQGGRLDYVALMNFPLHTAETHLVSHLLSDHFALETTLPLSPLSFVARPRLAIPKSQLPHLVSYIQDWYGITKGMFSTADSLYQGLLDNIKQFSWGNRSPPSSRISAQRIYARDPVLLHCQQNLASYQRRWQQDPSDTDAHDAMVAVARHLTELRKEIRSRYWEKFLANIRSDKSLTGIWRNVNRVRGKSRHPPGLPDPARKAQELLQTWTSASALAGLPDIIKTALTERRPRRLQLIAHNISLHDDTCVPITQDELLYAVKHGKSTAPGEDGLTYDILNALLVLDENPILDLFNLSYASGHLPTAWKSAIIIPIPKGDGTFRPISLTSCLSKMMERVLLQRLLYKLDEQLSPNLHGFRKGHSTSDCFIKCLSSVGITCRAFIDLKGAFDRANQEVIMEELIVKGVKGKLLGWINNYLCERKAKVWLQGVYSSIGNFELGTPQGGVLSPMLFNVLMDKLARHVFPQGAEVIIYADDILLQCDTPRTLTQALHQLETMCINMGLVINETKTKYQTNTRVFRTPTINAKKIDRVQSYPYLGTQLSLKKNLNYVTHVKNQCLLRLAPLRVLAHRGLGAGVPVLRMFYISVVRSLIDYAAPVLVQYSPTQLKPLESIQNEGMRIILGCPRTAKIELLRAELSLPSIVCRIRELTCRALCRMARHGPSPPLPALTALRVNPRSPANAYLRILFKLLTKFDVLDSFLNLVNTPHYPSWRPHRVAVDVEHLAQPKHTWLPQELHAHFMNKLTKYSRTQAVHIYCDGSVDGTKSGCGLYIRNYSSPTEYTDTQVSRRLPDHLSSTRAELYGILEGLRISLPLRRDVYFFVDSQAALYALLSSSPTDCDIVNRCLNCINHLEGDNIRVQFTWIPSHIGILLNEKADTLARHSTSLRFNAEDPTTEFTYNYVKGRLSNYSANTITEDLDYCYHSGSPSSVHYVQVCQGSSATYGKQSARHDLVVMRLRLGYKYYWEFSGEDPVPCAVCGTPGGHTLQHYVTECPSLAHFRPQGHQDLPSLITWFLTNNSIPDILKEHPQFAPRW